MSDRDPRIPPPCAECPGQHQITLRFTVCSPCDSTIALGEAMAKTLVTVGGGVVIQHHNGAQPVEVSWTMKAIEVVK
jgi:hypothetical protein